MSRALTADEFERARRILMRRDPKIGAVMKKVGRCGLPIIAATSRFPRWCA